MLPVQHNGKANPKLTMCCIQQVVWVTSPPKPSARHPISIAQEHVQQKQTANILQEHTQILALQQTSMFAIVAWSENITLLSNTAALAGSHVQPTAHHTSAYQHTRTCSAWLLSASLSPSTYSISRKQGRCDSSASSSPAPPDVRHPTQPPHPPLLMLGLPQSELLVLMGSVVVEQQLARRLTEAMAAFHSSAVDPTCNVHEQSVQDKLAKLGTGDHLLCSNVLHSGKGIHLLQQSVDCWSCLSAPIDVKSASDNKHTPLGSM